MDFQWTRCHHRHTIDFLTECEISSKKEFGVYRAHFKLAVYNNDYIRPLELIVITNNQLPDYSSFFYIQGYTCHTTWPQYFHDTLQNKKIDGERNAIFAAVRSSIVRGNDVRWISAVNGWWLFFYTTEFSTRIMISSPVYDFSLDYLCCIQCASYIG